ncbi:MAG: hypothetical protein JWO74_4953, partial [Solirubrobacterales bacterium]|nr:hypothetical protein [Solirubrobacterales bacterium]
AAPRDALLRLAWHETAAAGANDRPNGGGDAAAALDAHPDLAAIAATPGAVPTTVLADFRAAGDPTPAAAREVLDRALGLLQAALADDRLGASRLVFVTQGAVAAGDDDAVPALAAAPLWGLVRSAQSEHPDRFVLVDLDDAEASLAALGAAVATGEPQVAVRDGRFLVPRLERVGAPGTAPDLARAAAGTVLITGGTSGVGAELARHLVARHGVTRLLLTSRRGAQAPGARELEQELAGLGASVRIVACDVGDRAQVEALVRGEAALSGVVHAAGTADNSLIASMDAAQVDRVLAPKVDAALHLHELTQDLDLGLFVLCSSMAATFGGPGQGNYAAANAFLDALAARRRASGRAGVSIAWGLWEGVGMTRDLTGGLEQLLGRLSGSAALRPFPAELGVELFDGALAAGLPLVFAGPYRVDIIRQEVAAGTVPPLLSGLVPARPQAAGARRPGSLQDRLSGAGDQDRHEAIVEEIRVQIATALGYESPESIRMDRSFLELGFDSLVSLELRKRLQSVTGLTLASTIMFDHPTPAALIAHLEGLGAANGADGRAVAAAPPSANGHAGAGSVTEMFRRAHQLGKAADGITLAEAAARLRPRFGLSHADDRAPAVIPLAAGAAEPIVFCIPSLVATAGPHEYVRFAKSFRERRDVVALPVPGFAADELLPSTLEAAAMALAAAIKRHAAGREVAIVGYSTGGLLAQAVAGACVREGVTPTAVVLLDSYTIESMWRLTDPVFDRMILAEGSGPEITEHTLMAMGTYLGMLATWAPTQAVAPTLLVKASDPMPGVVDDGDWTATWTAHHTTVEVPGSHLTMLEDHADSTARAIEEWLLGRPRGSPRRGRMRRLHRAR